MSFFASKSRKFSRVFVPAKGTNIVNGLKRRDFRGKVDVLISAKKANLQGDLRGNFLLINCYVQEVS